MVSVKDNETLTRVGEGTPMGELMRRYWQPVALSWELHILGSCSSASWAKER